MILSLPNSPYPTEYCLFTSYQPQETGFWRYTQAFEMNFFWIKCSMSVLLAYCMHTLYVTLVNVTLCPYTNNKLID